MKSFHNISEKIKIIIAKLLIVQIISVISFTNLSSQTAHAQSSVSPVNQCILVIEKQENSQNSFHVIKCTDLQGTTTSFKLMFYAQRAGIASIGNKNLQIWTNTGSQQLSNKLNYSYYLVVRNDGANDSDFSKLKIAEVMIPVNDYVAKNGKPCGMSMLCQEYNIRTGSHTAEHTYMISHKDFSNIAPPEDVELSDEQRSIVNNFKYLSTRIPIGIANKINRIPNANTLSNCKNKGVRQQSGVNLLLNQDIDFRNEMIDGLISSFHAVLDDYANNYDVDNDKLQKVKALAQEILSKQKSTDWKDWVINSEKDNDLFRTYYSTELGNSWPNVAITETTMNLFRNLVSDSSMQAPIGYYAPASSRTLGYVVPTSWFSGTSFVDEMMNSMDQAQLEQMFKTELEIAYAYYYIKSNLMYNECAQEQGDTDFAVFNSDYYTQLETLLNSTYTNANPSVTANNEDDCENEWTDKEGKTHKPGMMAVAFCKLVVVVKGWADSLFELAVHWLEKSIGLVESEAEIN